MEERNFIEIEILYETKDYWHSYLSHYLSFYSITLHFLAFSVFGLFLLFFLFSSNEIEFLHLVNIFLISFQFVILFGFIMTYFSVGNAKKLNVGKFKYIFSEKGVAIAANSFTSQVDWTYFLQCKETKNYFVLNMKNGQKDLLPKRFFQDYTQIADFKNLVRSKLGERASLKKSKENLGLK